jgi:3'-phosphoadenosine 5'-phosphosulfate (PAPS) 3'-phosphatase
VIAGGLQALTPDIPVLSEEDPPSGAFVSTGSVTGWSIRWTAPKSL